MVCIGVFAAGGRAAPGCGNREDCGHADRETGCNDRYSAAWSSHSLGMAPVLQHAGIPMISPVSTNPKVTLAGDYIFRVCLTDPLQGQIMAQFAFQDFKARTAAVFANINSDYSMGLSELGDRRSDLNF